MNPFHPEPFGKLRHLTVWWWFFFCFVFPSSSGWPVFPLKPEQTENNGLWWADQRPCSRTLPSGACPRCDTHRLPPAFISTMDCTPTGAACRIFSPSQWRENTKVTLAPPHQGEQNEEQTDGEKLGPSPNNFKLMGLLTCSYITRVVKYSAGLTWRRKSFSHSPGLKVQLLKLCLLATAIQSASHRRLKGIKAR